MVVSSIHAIRIRSIRYQVSRFWHDSTCPSLVNVVPLLGFLFVQLSIVLFCTVQYCTLAVCSFHQVSRFRTHQTKKRGQTNYDLCVMGSTFNRVILICPPSKPQISHIWSDPAIGIEAGSGSWVCVVHCTVLYSICMQ